MGNRGNPTNRNDNRELRVRIEAFEAIVNCTFCFEWMDSFSVVQRLASRF